MIDFQRCGIFATPIIHRFCGQDAGKIAAKRADSGGLERSRQGIAAPGKLTAPVAPIPYSNPNLQRCGTAIEEDSNRDCVFSALEDGLAGLYG
jgi:hypothetical protein